MKRLTTLAAVMFLSVLTLSPAAASAQTARTRLLDMTADVLKPNESEFGVLWARYAIGLAPGLQVEAELAGYLVSLVNLRAEYQFVRYKDFRMSAEVAGFWFAAGASEKVDLTALAVPMWIHATTPIQGPYELTLGAGYRIIHLANANSSQQFRSLTAEASVIRYDRRGAWLVTVKAPILRTAAVNAEDVLGNSALSSSLTLDDTNAWSVLFARDQTFGKTTHFRFGAGYRNRPGIIAVESWGRAVVELDLYWR